MIANDTVVGCILAGGRSSRMGGGDKTLRPLGARPMLASVLDRLQPQVSKIVLNANGDPERLSQFGLPVVADSIGSFAGPLAGVSACMRWATDTVIGATHIATVAADTPFLPIDLVQRLTAETSLASDTIAMATSGGHRHPVFALWPIALRPDLDAWLQGTDTYKVIVWAKRHRLKMVDFPMIEAGADRIDPFFNINTPDELERAARILDRLTNVTVKEAP